METLKVSVIIPTYRGQEHLGEAIQSVLDQTYGNFELIVVNDASPDDTASVIAQYNDPRIKYIVHEKNLGVDQARNTGIQSSTGEIIAFLDQDDYFHPEKMASHVIRYRQQPKLGFTYNARFELNYSAKTIRSIWRPASNITLADLVLWFPIAPSDWVLRREWALKLVDIVNQNRMWTGGEIVYLGNLFMSNCIFGLVNRALNYRRHHSGRIFRDLAGGCRSEISAQNTIFADPRCPGNVLALQHIAHANIFMFWAFRAFAQDETSLGQEFIRSAVQEKPAVLEGKPSELVNFLLINCIDDENVDHSILLKRMFDQIPHELSFVSEQCDWAVARGYLLKAARAAIWGRPVDAERYVQSARQLHAEIDDDFLSHLVKSLIDYEIEFGRSSADLALENLKDCLRDLEDAEGLKKLAGWFAMDRAFQSYYQGEYDKVPSETLAAILSYPKNMLNRGLYAILFRSLTGLIGIQNENPSPEIISPQPH